MNSAKLHKLLLNKKDEALNVALEPGNLVNGGGKGGGARVGVVECWIFIRNTFPVSAIGSVIGRAEFHNFVFHRRLICTADAQKQLRPAAGGAGGRDLDKKKTITTSSA